MNSSIHVLLVKASAGKTAPRGRVPDSPDELSPQARAPEGDHHFAVPQVREVRPPARSHDAGEPW